MRRGLPTICSTPRAKITPTTLGSTPGPLQAGLLKADCVLQGGETLVLELHIKSSWLGRFLDPRVELLAGEQADQQTFERGVAGLRYLNLTGLAAPCRPAHCACVAGIAGCWASRACG